MNTYNKIKKDSEGYAKLMRDNFPLSFECETLNDILFNLTDDKKQFAEQIKKQWNTSEFKDYIYSIYNEKKSLKENKEKVVSKSVSELLNAVWYDFYICKTQEDVKQFKKYYKSGEALCTFNNINWRLNSYHIFWIVKKDIENIQHWWDNKNRQDLYWTSCCSIQINKSNNNDLSIKNRYNHKVRNCDATFSNNLDNIADGLTEAFNTEFRLNTSKKNKSFELYNFRELNWVFIYYNYEINNIYYWINKIIKNWSVTYYNKDRYIIVDYFLIDLKENKIISIDNNFNDCFKDLTFNKIEVKKKWYNTEEDKEGVLTIYYN